jgi:endogenous inhibitor of DNA gyrase (YacG/DUF329 family)
MEKKICTNCNQERPVSSFYKRKNRNYNSYCRTCRSEYQRNRYNALKLKAVNLLGGKCSKCGYNKNLAAIDFHHLNPEDKDPNWNNIFKQSWNIIQEELKKCTVVCSNCHAEIHNPNLIFENVSEDYRKTTNKTFKNCPQCDKQIQGYTKFCSDKCYRFNQRKTNWPSKEELIKLLENNSMKELGRKFGVSDNAIRNWCKHYCII